MDTIAALATAMGKAGIAVIRVSGDDALAVCGKVIKNADITAFESRRAYYRSVRCPDGSVIDDAVITVFRAPNSYTGEDTVEISCHGSGYIVLEIMRNLVANGARQAEAGEFTKRAFLNGKLTLTGAEAVGRLIESENRYSAALALAQSRGGLSEIIVAIYDKVAALISEIYVYIDYPGEDLNAVSIDEMIIRLENVQNEIERLINSFNTGKIINGGIRCAILGKPNAGKSTLLNLLSGEDVAIVTDIPGTTRDIITSSVNLNGYSLKFSDTAGLRETEDYIEGIGIERALKRAEESDLIFAVYDAESEDSRGMKPDDIFDEVVTRLKNNGKKILGIINKTDKISNNAQNIYGNIKNFCDDILFVSAKEDTARGVEINGVRVSEAVGMSVAKLFHIDGDSLKNGAIIAEERQHLALCAAASMIEGALDSLNRGVTQDIVCLDLERTLASIAECDSRDVSGDIVDRIFHNFCVGK